MFRRVLVANRGEIAVRVIRALHELGVEAVAVYSTADADALHTRLADRAVRIGPPPAAESYLRIPSIVAAAETSGCDAVPPGCGLRGRHALRREGARSGAPRRDPGARRLRGRRAHARRARMLDPAAPPEADRGVPVAGAHARAARADGGRGGASRAGDRLPQR